MISVRKVALKLTDEQQAMLDGQSKICNWLYNRLLETANELRVEYRRTQNDEVGKKLYTQRGLRNLVPGIKEKHLFLLAVHSSPLKNAALRLSDAIQDYQDSRHGRRPGPLVNWPKFRSWKRKWFSLLYDEPKKGFAVKGKMLKLYLGQNERGKRIRLKLEMEEMLPTKLKGSIKMLRITRDGSKRYFAVFTIETAIFQPEQIGKEPRIIAFDPNHKNLAYGVDLAGRAIEIQNLSSLKKLDARIDQLKSLRDRCKKQSVKVVREDGSYCWKSSRRWMFFNRRLEEAYRVRREQTKTFLYTLSNQLCKRYEFILVGDYTPNGGGITNSMRRSMNNQSLIGRFKKTLTWVALRSGRVFVEYDEDGTTRTCSECHFIVEGGIPPEVREWTCPECGTIHIRDENAAINGLVKTIQKCNLLPRSGHCRKPLVTGRWVWWVQPSGVFSASRGVDGSPIRNTARKLKRWGAAPCKSPD